MGKSEILRILGSISLKYLHGELGTEATKITCELIGEETDIEDASKKTISLIKRIIDES